MKKSFILRLFLVVASLGAASVVLCHPKMHVSQVVKLFNTPESQRAFALAFFNPDMVKDWSFAPEPRNPSNLIRLVPTCLVELHEWYVENPDAPVDIDVFESLPARMDAFFNQLQDETLGETAFYSQAQDEEGGIAVKTTQTNRGYEDEDGNFILIEEDPLVVTKWGKSKGTYPVYGVIMGCDFVMHLLSGELSNNGGAERVAAVLEQWNALKTRIRGEFVARNGEDAIVAVEQEFADGLIFLQKCAIEMTCKNLADHGVEIISDDDADESDYDGDSDSDGKGTEGDESKVAAPAVEMPRREHVSVAAVQDEPFVREVSLDEKAQATWEAIVDLAATSNPGVMPKYMDFLNGNICEIIEKNEQVIARQDGTNFVCKWLCPEIKGLLKPLFLDSDAVSVSVAVTRALTAQEEYFQQCLAHLGGDNFYGRPEKLVFDMRVSTIIRAHMITRALLLGHAFFYALAEIAARRQRTDMSNAAIIKAVKQNEAWMGVCKNALALTESYDREFIRVNGDLGKTVLTMLSDGFASEVTLEIPELAPLFVFAK